MSFTLFVFLQEFEGSVVVTSHDRRLLREVCQVPGQISTISPQSYLETPGPKQDPVPRNEKLSRQACTKAQRHKTKHSMAAE